MGDSHEAHLAKDGVDFELRHTEALLQDIQAASSDAANVSQESEMR